MLIVNSKQQPISQYNRLPENYTKLCPCQDCPCNMITCDVASIFVLNEFYPGVTDFDETQAVFWCVVDDISVPMISTSNPYTGLLTKSTDKLYYQGKILYDQDGKNITQYYTYDEMSAFGDNGKTWHVKRDSTASTTFRFPALGQQSTSQSASGSDSASGSESNNIFIKFKISFANLPEKMRLDKENPADETDCYKNVFEIYQYYNGESSWIRYQNITDRPVMCEGYHVLKGYPFPWPLTTVSQSGQKINDNKKYLLSKQDFEAMMDCDSHDWIKITASVNSRKKVLAFTKYFGFMYSCEKPIAISNFNADEPCVIGTRYGIMPDGTKCTDCPGGDGGRDDEYETEKGKHVTQQTADAEEKGGDEEEGGDTGDTDENKPPEEDTGVEVALEEDPPAPPYQDDRIGPVIPQSEDPTPPSDDKTDPEPPSNDKTDPTPPSNDKTDPTPPAPSPNPPPTPSPSQPSPSQPSPSRPSQTSQSQPSQTSQSRPSQTSQSQPSPSSSSGDSETHSFFRPSSSSDPSETHSFFGPSTTESDLKISIIKVEGEWSEIVSSCNGSISFTAERYVPTGVVSYPAFGATFGYVNGIEFDIYDSEGNFYKHDGDSVFFGFNNMRQVLINFHRFSKRDEYFNTGIFAYGTYEYEMPAVNSTCDEDFGMHTSFTAGPKFTIKVERVERTI